MSWSAVRLSSERVCPSPPHPPPPEQTCSVWRPEHGLVTHTPVQTQSLALSGHTAEPPSAPVFLLVKWCWAASLSAASVEERT